MTQEVDGKDSVFGAELGPSLVPSVDGELVFWRRDAIARLQMALWLHRGVRNKGDEPRAAHVRVDTIYPTLAALEEVGTDWASEDEIAVILEAAALRRNPELGDGAKSPEQPAVARFTDAELDRIAWLGVCRHHCHRITCDGPIDEASTCARAHDIARLVLAAAAAVPQPERMELGEQESK